MAVTRKGNKTVGTGREPGADEELKIVGGGNVINHYHSGSRPMVFNQCHIGHVDAATVPHAAEPELIPLFKGPEGEAWMDQVVRIGGEVSEKRLKALKELRTCVTDPEQLHEFISALMLCVTAYDLMKQVHILSLSESTNLPLYRAVRGEFLDHILSFAVGVSSGTSYNNLRYHLRNLYASPATAKKE